MMVPLSCSYHTNRKENHHGAGQIAPVFRTVDHGRELTASAGIVSGLAACQARPCPACEKGVNERPNGLVRLLNFAVFDLAIFINFLKTAFLFFVVIISYSLYLNPGYKHNRLLSDFPVSLIIK